MLVQKFRTQHLRNVWLLRQMLITRVVVLRLQIGIFGNNWTLFGKENIIVCFDFRDCNTQRKDRLLSSCLWTEKAKIAKRAYECYELLAYLS